MIQTLTCLVLRVFLVFCPKFGMHLGFGSFGSKRVMKVENGRQNTKVPPTLLHRFPRSDFSSKGEGAPRPAATSRGNSLKIGFDGEAKTFLGPESWNVSN